MAKGLFVTGTSTEIGKTVIAAIICKILSRDRKKIAYYKPVQTGAVIDKKGRFIAPDARFVAGVMKGHGSFQAFHTYLFEEPVSPHLAAQVGGKKIKLKKIVNDYQKISKEFDFVVVEGAGGAFVPLNEKGALMSDIMKKLKLSAVVVSPAGLGAINHVGLTHAFLTSRSINVASVILISSPGKPIKLEKENARILKKLLKNKFVYLVPYLKGIETEKNLQGNIHKSWDSFPEIGKIRKWF